MQKKERKKKKIVSAFLRQEIVWYVVRKGSLTRRPPICRGVLRVYLELTLTRAAHLGSLAP